MPFSQRIYDTGLGAFVYYTKEDIDPAPAVTATSPNHTNNLDVATHVVLSEVPELEVNTITDLRSVPLSVSGQASVRVRFHSVAEDGGGGLFHWISTNTSADDDGVHITPLGYGGSGRWVRDTPESYANVQWFGAGRAVDDTGADDTAALENAVAYAGEGGHVWVPKGFYRFADLEFLNYQRIDCDGEAYMQGSGISPRTSTDLVLLTQNNRQGIQFYGGIWTECRYAFWHTATSTVVACIFERMRIYNCEVGFKIESTTGSKWRDIVFGGLVAEDYDYGWYLGRASGNVINANSFEDCQLQKFKICGLFIESSTQRKRLNVIRRCWFENSPGDGIIIGTYSNTTTIKDCYFESTSLSTTIFPIQILTADTDGSAYIENNYFAVPNSRTNIFKSGPGRLLVQKNDFVLGQIAGSNQRVLQLADVASGAGVQLYDNFIKEISGSTSYQDRLFQYLFLCEVQWSRSTKDSIFTGAISLVGATGKYTIEVETNTVDVPSTGGPTVISVSRKVGSGDVVKLVTDTSVAIESEHPSGNIILQDGSIYYMEAGDSLTLQSRIVGGAIDWYEINRSKPATAAILSGPTVDRPLTPTVGLTYLDTTLDVPIWFDGDAWRTASGAGSAGASFSTLIERYIPVYPYLGFESGVNSWQSVALSANTLTSTTVSEQPLITSESVDFNNQASLDIIGIKRLVCTTPTAGILSSINSTFTIAFIGTKTSAASNSRAFHASDVSDTHKVSLTITGSISSQLTFSDGGGSTTLTFAGAMANDIDPHVVICSIDTVANSGILWLDGTMYTSSSGTVRSPVGIDRFSVCNSTTSSNGYGSIPEFRIYDGILSEAQELAIRKELEAIYV